MTKNCFELLLLSQQLKNFLGELPPDCAFCVRKSCVHRKIKKSHHTEKVILNTTTFNQTCLAMNCMCSHDILLRNKPRFNEYTMVDLKSPQLSRFPWKRPGGFSSAPLQFLKNC